MQKLLIFVSGKELFELLSCLMFCSSKKQFRNNDYFGGLQLYSHCMNIGPEGPVLTPM